MNKKQFTEHIGNIDERLVWQAEQIPDYRRQHRKKRIRGFAAVAATLVLMVCSFSVGALAFAHEVVVEVPVKQETLTLEEINLTMILPDSWSGKYSVQKIGPHYQVYSVLLQSNVDDGEHLSSGGVLFDIHCCEGAMTPEQFEKSDNELTESRYLFSTRDKTYVFHYADNLQQDVQWGLLNSEQEALYKQMSSEIKDIRFVVDNVLID